VAKSSTNLPSSAWGDPDIVFRDTSDVDVIVNVLDHVKEKTAVPVTDAERADQSKQLKTAGRNPAWRT
jgi:hypothetical protein